MFSFNMCRNVYQSATRVYSSTLTKTKCWILLKLLKFQREDKWCIPSYKFLFNFLSFSVFIHSLYCNWKLFCVKQREMYNTWLLIIAITTVGCLWNSQLTETSSKSCPTECICLSQTQVSTFVSVYNKYTYVCILCVYAQCTYILCIYECSGTMSEC